MNVGNSLVELAVDLGAVFGAQVGRDVREIAQRGGDDAEGRSKVTRAMLKSNEETRMGFPQDLIDTVKLHLDRLPPTDEPRTFDATRMRDDILSANSEWDAAAVAAAIKELSTKGGVDPVGI